MGVSASKAGVSEAAMLSATGKHPDEWFALLDSAGATEWSHTTIARWLSDLAVDGWWAQSITVRYEQARGMRLPGQQSDGTFAVSASRSVTVHASEDVPATAESDENDRQRPHDKSGPHAAVLAALTGSLSSELGVAPAATNARAKYPTVRWTLPNGESLLATLSPVTGEKVSVSLTWSKIADNGQLADIKMQLGQLLAKLPGWLASRRELHDA
jgi:hypothetical protein